MLLGRAGRWRAAIACVVAAVLGVAACSSSSEPQRIARARSIVLVVEENHSAAQVLGAPDLPQLNRLAQSGVVLDHYFAVTHPSLPNYLALTAGSTFGVRTDCTACTMTGSNLFDQLQRAGVSWRVYAQGLPGECPHGATVGVYARRHVPALVYTSVLDDPAMCRNVVPYDQFATDARDGTLPRFALVIPDLRHDMHGVDEQHVGAQDLRAADGFVANLAATLDGASQWRDGSRLVITFDEGGSYAPPPNRCCDGDAAGGHVATIVTGPGLAAGHDATDYDHYSLLRSIETAFDLGHLGKAADAASHDIPALVGSP